MSFIWFQPYYLGCWQMEIFSDAQVVEASEWFLKTGTACRLWKERKPHVWMALYLFYENPPLGRHCGWSLGCPQGLKPLPLIPTSSPRLTVLLFMPRPLTMNCSSGPHRTGPPVSLPQTQTLPLHMTAHHTPSLASTPFAPPALPWSVCEFLILEHLLSFL